MRNAITVIVVLGLLSSGFEGVLSSTLLTLFVLPALYRIAHAEIAGARRAPV